VARVAGVDLPREKRVEIGLTYVYGIGRSTARKILAETGVDPDTKVRDLAEGEVAKIRTYVDQNLEVEGDLRRETNQNIRRLIDIGSYRGIRHRRGLPVRGQRTKTNARQRKGVRGRPQHRSRRPALAGRAVASAVGEQPEETLQVGRACRHDRGQRRRAGHAQRAAAEARPAADDGKRRFDDVAHGGLLVAVNRLQASEQPRS